MPDVISHTLAGQLFGLFILALPIACIVRTVIFEEVFREPREWCQNQSKACKQLMHRKFYYLFTCEYCFSHYITLFFIAFTGYKLLMEDWRGYVIAFFALVLVANAYLSIYSRLRLELQRDRAVIKSIEKDVEIKEGV